MARRVVVGLVLALCSSPTWASDIKTLNCQTEARVGDRTVSAGYVRLQITPSDIGGQANLRVTAIEAGHKSLLLDTPCQLRECLTPISDASYDMVRPIKDGRLRVSIDRTTGDFYAEETGLVGTLYVRNMTIIERGVCQLGPAPTARF